MAKTIAELLEESKQLAERMAEIEKEIHRLTWEEYIHYEAMKRIGRPYNGIAAKILTAKRNGWKKVIHHFWFYYKTIEVSADDQPAILEEIRDWLESQGYKVEHINDRYGFGFIITLE